LSILKSIEKNREKHKKLCDDIRKSKIYFDWVGIYWMNYSNQTLELGVFSGTPTEHVSIPFGKGVCGQVALTGETLEIGNVKEEENYIACSLETQSEIVVPIYKNGKLIGQLDIDSHSKNPFKPEDHIFLENICRSIAESI
jgi:L-methionine (R)-S-oxide reductase|tara:strand:- start:65288 stop:65710 length:423 start_codon:yes stop_codon:yes gene_type:complete